MSEIAQTQEKKLISAPGFNLSENGTCFTATMNLDEIIENPPDIDVETGAALDPTMYSDVAECRRAILEEPALLGVFGFSTTKEGQVVTVTGPTNAHLTSLRQAMPPEIGLHTGKFVDFTPPDTESGGFIKGIDFVARLAQEEIPMTTESPLVAHDNFLHRRGYNLICDAIFNRFVLGAQKIDLARDTDMTEKLVKSFDQLSDTDSPYLGLGNHTLMRTSNLALIYRTFMPPLLSGMRAFRDVKAQEAMARNLLEYIK